MYAMRWKDPFQEWAKVLAIALLMALCMAGISPGEDLKYSAVRVTAGRASGSAVPFNRGRGYVDFMTAEHVAQFGPNVTIEDFTTRTYPRPAATYSGKVIASGPGDVAVIRVYTNDDFYFRSIARTNPEVGDRVYYAGCGGGRPPTSHVTRITSYRNGMYMTSSPPDKGQSGGPLVNANGELIGIVSVALCDRTRCYEGGFVPLSSVKAVAQRASAGGNFARRQPRVPNYRQPDYGFEPDFPDLPSGIPIDIPFEGIIIGPYGTEGRLGGGGVIIIESYP